MSRLRAYRLYLALGAAASFAFSMIFTILAVYFVQTVGMNPLQLVLVGTVLELTIVLAEVPTGIVADVYSRRRSVIIGYALIGACYVTQGFVPRYLVILGAEVVRGLGETFISGSLEAWIADEMGADRVGDAYLRYGQTSRIGGFAGIAAGTALGAFQLNAPIILGGGLLLAISGLLAVVMPETGFRPAPRGAQSSWRTMFDIAGEGLTVVRRRPVALMLVLVGVVYGAFSEGFDRLWEAHFLTTFTFPVWPALPPVVWIGLLKAGAMLLGLAAAEVLIRRGEITGSRRLGLLLLVNSAGLIVAILFFGLAPTFAVAAVAFWAASVLKTLQHPITMTWLNRYLPSRVRATVISLLGQADALGQVAGGPVVGAVGLRSLRSALVFSSMILTPSLLLYGRGLRLEDDEALGAE